MAKKNKSEKLMEKINILIEKLEAETNPFKRALYTTKLELLNARLQKQINIIDIREKFDKEKQERQEAAKARFNQNTAEKLKKIKERNAYKAEMRHNKDFDPESPDFAFKDELKMYGGDVEKLIEQLTKDGGDNTGELVFKIKSAIENRENYEKSKEDLKEMKTNGSKIQRKAKIEDIKSTVKENSLVVREKTNVFKRIFNSIKSGFIEFNQSRKANKRFKNDVQFINDDIEKRKNGQLTLLDAEYQRVMQEFEDRRKEIEDQFKAEFDSNNDRTNFMHVIRNQSAADKSNKIIQEFYDRKSIPISSNTQDNTKPDAGQEPVD